MNSSPPRIALAAVALAAIAGSSRADVVHGRIGVIQNDSGNNPTSVTLSKEGGSPDFAIVGGNRGDFDIDFGPGNGPGDAVVMTTVRQNGRDNAQAPNAGGPSGTRYATSTIALGGGGSRFFIPVFEAGNNPETGDEFNMDVAAASFAFADGWLGGSAFNSSNNQTLDSIVASPGIALGSQFVDDPSTGGQYGLDLRGLGGSSQSGILLVTGAKNEDNYALSRANADGTFTVFAKDNGSNGGSYENDPVAFVYIPSTAVGLTAGRVLGDSTFDLLIGGGLGSASITAGGTGSFFLQIAGQSSLTGTLLLSAEGGDGLNVDNIVSYEAMNDGWLIQTRDLPGTGLQNLGAIPAFSFAFLPDAGGISPLGPNVIPEPATLALSGLGLAGALGLAARRRARRAA